MINQINRLPTGGIIDRSVSLPFTYDGVAMTGYKGDTVASALLANNVNLVARSFKYHRPRGFFAAGAEDPNGIFTIGKGVDEEPNMPATMTPLVHGMVINSQNRWPSLKFDVYALTGKFARLLPSGFYYKTFMWPAAARPLYEKVIRHIAGFGKTPCSPDPDQYDHRYVHCDLLVVGAGPAGLMSALTAAKAGKRVLLCDENYRVGGGLQDEDTIIDGQPALTWIAQTKDALRAFANVEIMTSTNVFGYYDHNYVMAVSRNKRGAATRQTMHKIRAKNVVLATGAVERSMLFDGNDLPGVMLASASRTWIKRYSVKPGSKAVLYVNNDSGYDTITALRENDIQVAAIIDYREDASAEAKSLADGYGLPIMFSARITKAHGSMSITSVEVNTKNIPCDLVCVAGGWSPTLHLFSQAGGKVLFYDAKQTLMADQATHEARLVGAVVGQFDLSEALQAAQQTVEDCFGIDANVVVTVEDAPLAQTSIKPDWSEAAKITERTKTFVDLQNDVTVADIALANREGYCDVELTKRYTTTGMGTDQGKTSNVHAIGLIAQYMNKAPQDVGHTTFRAPYTPVTYGAIAGRAVGADLAPLRRTPFHHMHIQANCVFEPSSEWAYPKYYPLPDESMDDAIEREVLNTRQNVGAVDMSSLGKIEIHGPDAVEFLERTYINKFAKLPIGRSRYGLMLRYDGFVMDDGTVSRLAKDRFLLTLTTAATHASYPQLERLHQIEFPELDVRIMPVSEHWASLAIAGPNARKVLGALKPDFDISNEGLPFLDFRDGMVAGIPARVFRISFSGEMSFEINVPAQHAYALWQAVFMAGGAFGIMPYGLEALDVMRIEKGHLSIGTEIDGKTTPDDLGLGRMAKKDAFYIGAPLLNRPEFHRTDRKQLVGLVPSDGKTRIARGSHILDEKFTGQLCDTMGHVTATIISPTLDKPIALALVSGGRERIGTTMFATSPSTGDEIEVTVTSPVFYDEAGDRLRV